MLFQLSYGDRCKTLRRRRKRCPRWYSNAAAAARCKIYERAGQNQGPIIS